MSPKLSRMAGATFVVLLLSSQTALAGSQSAARIAKRRDARITASVKGVAESAALPRDISDLIRRRAGRSSSSSSKVSPSPTPPSNGNQNLASVRQRIVDLVNEQRRKNGLIEVRQESRLETSAQRHAEDMKKRGYFDHETPEGKSPTDRIRDAGYPLTGRWYTGENIADGQKTPEEVMKDWMNSSGHRANILKKEFRDIGIGFYQNMWVQNFGAHDL